MQHFTVFFDGQCGMCRTEVAWLMSRSEGRTEFRDLRDPNCGAASLGLSESELLGSLHALRGEEVISGREGFGEMYSRAGMPDVLAWTAWPGVRLLADAGYRLFARHRVLLSRLFGGAVWRWYAKRFPLQAGCLDGVCEISPRHAF